MIRVGKGGRSAASLFCSIRARAEMIGKEGLHEKNTLYVNPVSVGYPAGRLCRRGKRGDGLAGRPGGHGQPGGYHREDGVL